MGTIVGNMSIHENWNIAKFKGRGHSSINQGLIAMLEPFQAVTEAGVIISDELNHASIIDSVD